MSAYFLPEDNDVKDVILDHLMEKGVEYKIETRGFKKREVVTINDSCAIRKDVLAHFMCEDEFNIIHSPEIKNFKHFSGVNVFSFTKEKRHPLIASGYCIELDDDTLMYLYVCDHDSCNAGHDTGHNHGCFMSGYPTIGSVLIRYEITETKLKNYKVLENDVLSALVTLETFDEQIQFVAYSDFCFPEAGLMITDQNGVILHDHIDFH